MAEQPQPAAARAFVEAERETMEGLARGPWTFDGAARTLHAPDRADAHHIANFCRLADGRWIAHVRTSHAQALDLIRQQADEIERQAAEIAALSKFKAYVHRRLDEAGVPADPDSPHKAEGCRIGGRLDIVLARVAKIDRLRALVSALESRTMEGWSHVPE